MKIKNKYVKENESNEQNNTDIEK